MLPELKRSRRARRARRARCVIHGAVALCVSAAVLGVLAFGYRTIPALGPALDPGHGAWTSAAGGRLPSSQTLTLRAHPLRQLPQVRLRADRHPGRRRSRPHCRNPAQNHRNHPATSRHAPRANPVDVGLSGTQPARCHIDRVAARRPARRGAARAVPEPARAAGR